VSRHDILREEWDALLTRRDLIGGNLYFKEVGEFVGRVQRIENMRDGVKFKFAWCATKTKRRGWTRRQRTHLKRRRERFYLDENAGVVEFCDCKLFLKGRDLLEERHIVEPLTRSQRREWKRHGRPLPLFDR
jgi:hypothetical protein